MEDKLNSVLVSRAVGYVLLQLGTLLLVVESSFAQSMIHSVFSSVATSVIVFCGPAEYGLRVLGSSCIGIRRI